MDPHRRRVASTDRRPRDESRAMNRFAFGTAPSRPRLARASSSSSTDSRTSSLDTVPAISRKRPSPPTDRPATERPTDRTTERTSNERTNDAGRGTLAAPRRASRPALVGDARAETVVARGEARRDGRTLVVRRPTEKGLSGESGLVGKTSFRMSEFQHGPRRAFYPRFGVVERA